MHRSWSRAVMRRLGLQDMDEAQASFALAEKTAPNAVEPLLASARLLAVTWRP